VFRRIQFEETCTTILSHKASKRPTGTHTTTYAEVSTTHHRGLKNGWISWPRR